MIKGHTDIDIWNTGFFINADYFSDDFIIYNNTGKDLTRKTLAHPFFHNNSYKTTYTSFILCLSGTSEIEIDSINYSTKENTLLFNSSKKSSMCQFEYRGNRFIENISCIALQKNQ